MSLPEPFREGDIDWQSALSHLDDRGFAVIPAILTDKICKEIVAAYADDRKFRSRIEMERYAFGKGEYKYFAYPLPSIVQQLRYCFYPRLASLANEWLPRLGSKRTRYPGTLGEFIEQCHRAGQERPTPLMLKYGAGDFNCLHQDLYGEMVFPFQVTFFLSRRGKDFEGGEFVLAEQRPRNNPVSRCSLRTRATRSSLQFIIAPFAAREVIIEPIFGTESAPFTRARGTR